MPIARPKTKSGELLDIISRVIAKSSKHLDPNTAKLEVLRWERDADAVIKVDAVEGYLAKAKIAEALGDIDSFDRWAKNAKNLGLTDLIFAEYSLVGYANLGYASKGLQVFRDHVDVSKGNICATIRMAAAVGAFEQMRLLMKKSIKSCISLDSAGIWPNTIAAAEILEFAGVSDDDCAKVIDAAGEVLRNRKLFWTGDQPTFFVDDDPPSVLMRYNVDVTYSDASAMNLEVADLLIDRNLDRCDFIVGFMGSRV